MARRAKTLVTGSGPGGRVSGSQLKPHGDGGRPVRSEEDFEAWVAVATERLDPFMAWLGVVFALLVGYELAVELSPGAARGLSIAGWVIWALFAVEFGVKLWLAPRRLRFVRRHGSKRQPSCCPRCESCGSFDCCGLVGRFRRRGS